APPYPLLAVRFSLSRCCAQPALHSFPTRRSSDLDRHPHHILREPGRQSGVAAYVVGLLARLHHRAHDHVLDQPGIQVVAFDQGRSEEHTSELQSRENLVCRLLLEKKKTTQTTRPT